MFPQNYDINIYKRYNLDLKEMNDDEIHSHYLQYGILEGRNCCEINNRNDLIKYIPNEYNCLEIGPFMSPVLKEQLK
jgi:hypothetical protein